MKPRSHTIEQPSKSKEKHCGIFEYVETSARYSEVRSVPECLCSDVSLPSKKTDGGGDMGLASPRW